MVVIVSLFTCSRFDVSWCKTTKHVDGIAFVKLSNLHMPADPIYNTRAIPGSRQTPFYADLFCMMYYPAVSIHNNKWYRK